MQCSSAKAIRWKMWDLQCCWRYIMVSFNPFIVFASQYLVSLSDYSKLHQNLLLNGVLDSRCYSFCRIYAIVSLVSACRTTSFCLIHKFTWNSSFMFTCTHWLPQKHTCPCLLRSSLCIRFLLLIQLEWFGILRKCISVMQLIKISVWNTCACALILSCWWLIQEWAGDVHLLVIYGKQVSTLI